MGSCIIILKDKNNAIISHSPFSASLKNKKYIQKHQKLYRPDIVYSIVKSSKIRSAASS